MIQNNKIPKTKLLITLIHNNDLKRLNYIRPQIDKLRKKIPDTIQVQYQEISSQPEIKPVSLNGKYGGIHRDYVYWHLNRKWLKYRLNKNRFIILDFTLLLLKSFKKYILIKKMV